MVMKVKTSEEFIKIFYEKAKSMTLTEILEAKKNLTKGEQGRFLTLLAKEMDVDLKWIVTTFAKWRYSLDKGEK